MFADKGDWLADVEYTATLQQVAVRVQSLAAGDAEVEMALRAAVMHTGCAAGGSFPSAPGKPAGPM